MGLLIPGYHMCQVIEVLYHPGNTAQWQNVGNRSWLRSVDVFWEISGGTFQILP